jgi:hypothetical protein
MKTEQPLTTLTVEAESLETQIIALHILSKSVFQQIQDSKGLKEKERQHQ